MAAANQSPLAADPQMVVVTRPAEACSEELVEQVSRLNWKIPEFEWAFNERDGKAATNVAQTIGSHRAEIAEEDSAVCSFLQWHTITSDIGFSFGQPPAVVACSKSFVRVVSHSNGTKMKVLALGNVCCSPLFRGKGYGAAVVAAALARLNEFNDIEHCLFETAIPPFYTKLGAVQIDKASVVNSTGDKTAFIDECVMVYSTPGAEPWPAGAIDLLGPSY